MIDENGAIITTGYQQTPDAILGKLVIAKENPRAKVMWKLWRENPQMFELAVGFVGKLQDDGTYTDCELIEISLVTKYEQAPRS